MALIFGAPSPEFVKKHGQLSCACCRKEGEKTPATQMPLGHPRSVTFKRMFASCDAHLEATRQAAERQIAMDVDDAYSEAAFNLSSRFRI